MQRSLINLLRRLWGHLVLQRRRQLGTLLILILITSFTEVLSIGAILPFLGVLTAPERVFQYPAFQPFIHIFNLSKPSDLLFPLTIIFCSAILMAGLMRLMLLNVNTRLSFAIGADLSMEMYRRTLYQPYAKHISRNSSEVIDGIFNKSNGVIYGVLLPTLILLSSSVMLIVILIVLLTINPVIALLTFIGFGSIYMGIIIFNRKKLIKNGKKIATESTKVIKCLQEGLGGIRDVLIDGSQSVYCKAYSDADLPLRKAQASNFYIGQIPRYGMEALGMLLIALLSYYLANQPDGVAKIIPTLGVLALGAQRLLPILQQGYASWSNIQGGQESLSDVLDLLDQPVPEFLNYPKTMAISFDRQIQLKNIEFAYGVGMPSVLGGISLVIKKGSRVGFIGATGSGKSTLIDVIMALLKPTNGTIEIDGLIITQDNYRSWQERVAHVPQSIFLADASVAENIAFGVPKDEIDYERVREVAEKAQISEIIDDLPNKYDTFVGERGVRLSGGQRQRIGIARALYKRAEVIILDEATSALDGETEIAVMKAIESLSDNLTILIVAHRLTTLKNCTEIIELADGVIKRSGSYREIVS